SDAQRWLSRPDDAWLKKVKSFVQGLLEKLFSVHGKYTRENVIDYFSDPDVITKELAFEERIDAKIDKDIVALGRIKTMKSMGLGRRHVVVDQPVQQIDSPPIQPETYQAESQLPESPQPELP